MLMISYMDDDAGGGGGGDDDGGGGGDGDDGDLFAVRDWRDWTSGSMACCSY